MSFITSMLGHLNYGTIFVLMLLESTVIPVPSELVVAPAAYHAAGGNLDIWLVILFSTLGADVGATINYLAGWYLGRPIIYKFANSKWGHLCLLNQEKVEKARDTLRNMVWLPLSQAASCQVFAISSLSQQAYQG